jgi:hypothetical protein
MTRMLIEAASGWYTGSVYTGKVHCTSKSPACELANAEAPVCLHHTAAATAGIVADRTAIRKLIAHL